MRCRAKWRALASSQSNSRRGPSLIIYIVHAMLTQFNDSEGAGLAAGQRSASIQEIIAIKRIALNGAEAGILNHAAELFFAGGAGDASGAHHVFLNQD